MCTVRKGKMWFSIAFLKNTCREGEEAFLLRRLLVKRGFLFLFC